MIHTQKYCFPQLQILYISILYNTNIGKDEGGANGTGTGDGVRDVEVASHYFQIEEISKYFLQFRLDIREPKNQESMLYLKNIPNDIPLVKVYIPSNKALASFKLGIKKDNATAADDNSYSSENDDRDE
jgi:hypothetical protein